MMYSLNRQDGDTLLGYLAVPFVIIDWLFPIIMTFAIYLCASLIFQKVDLLKVLF
ncbi:protein of unknown function [Bartonella clarridgeiae 73]|uniref:Uncharacterized protein n=1 Tax=Bartonella clarridgeiae (strain CCUG 45776 / CIP 104772 / 73) TaxID=696125 RepID=E6YJK3_BARC7|nr:protein of unknown function [Bartonella clarridgeiae 73]